MAYDDFGAGQARLLELIEIPPDYLKYDIGLIAGLADMDTATYPATYKLLGTFNELLHDLGIITLAEGVETQATAEVCAELGTDLLQGFYFGRPTPIVTDEGTISHTLIGEPFSTV